MASSNRACQNDLIHKQLNAFEKLVNAAINSFSKERLVHLLRLLLKKTAHVGRQLNSLKSLRKHIEALGDSPDDDKIRSHMDSFFQDVRYSKQLKEYFDDRIYLPLKTYFPVPPNVPNMAGIQEDLRNGVALNLSKCAEQLKFINNQWQNLLEFDEIQASYLDPDTTYELKDLGDCSNFERLARLVPDCLIKAFKSHQISKTWWIQADKVVKERVALQNNVKNLEYQLIRDAEEITELRKGLDEVDEEEKLVEKLKHEFDELEKRCEVNDDSVLSYERSIICEDLDFHLRLLPDMIRHRGATEAKIFDLERQIDDNKYRKESALVQLEHIEQIEKESTRKPSALKKQSKIPVRKSVHN
ncbi:unnamed protein product [Dimorphilus gyrociliatus]|uniref:Uncharacterized protein n=1 Tax=Dimorphilus gyrociliatus TaxID=2664684 RepID=A0A7I8V4N7_9ANNE|nr:unnamed protein product [Dimorphilus gyrociliatus]